MIAATWWLNGDLNIFFLNFSPKICFNVIHPRGTDINMEKRWSEDTNPNNEFVQAKFSQVDIEYEFKS